MQANKTTDTANTPSAAPAQWKGRWKLLLVLLVCAAPMIASYLTYYVIKPTGRTNFGTLIDPRQHPIPPLASSTLDGKPAGLDAWRGKWIMLRAGPGECGVDCREHILAMRQLRVMQGKAMERVERVWLITDTVPLATMAIREFDGVHMLRADPAAVAAWLPVEAGAMVADHLYLVDPLGNLMMRFPMPPAAAPEADKLAHYAKIKKDIAKLLKASAIG